MALGRRTYTGPEAHWCQQEAHMRTRRSSSYSSKKEEGQNPRIFLAAAPAFLFASAASRPLPPPPSSRDLRPPPPPLPRKRRASLPVSFPHAFLGRFLCLDRCALRFCLCRLRRRDNGCRQGRAERAGEGDGTRAHLCFRIFHVFFCCVCALPFDFESL